ncbi:MAG: GerAB/ArcD/ProY family transporter [Bacillota bacterium]|jgi:hypothetical protein
MSQRSYGLDKIQAISLSAVMCMGIFVSFSFNGHLIGHNLWIPFAISGGCGFLFFLLLRAVLKLYPGQSLPQIYQTAFGKSGRIGTVIFLGQFIFSFCYTLLAVFFFWRYSALPNTPLIVYAILIPVMSGIVVRMGLKAIAKICFMTVAVVMAILIFNTISVLPYGTFTNFLPLATGMDPQILAKSTLQFFVLHLGSMSLVLTFMFKAKEQKKASSFLWKGFVINIIFFSIVVARSVFVLGESLIVEFYHNNQVLRLMNLNNSASHTEILGLMAVAITVLMFLLILQYAVNSLAGSLYVWKKNPNNSQLTAAQVKEFQSGKAWRTVIPIVIIEIVLVMLMYKFNNMPNSLKLFSTLTFFVMINMISLIIVVCRGNFIKKTKKKED